MRKLLLLIAAVCVSVPSFAAYEYDAVVNGAVKVSDLSYQEYGSRVYEYHIEFVQSGVNRSDKKTYATSAYIIIHPAGPSIAGTYVLSDGTLDSDSYVLKDSDMRKAVDYSAEKTTELVITDNNDGTYTLSGTFRTKKGSNYYYYYYDAAASGNTFDLFGTEPSRGDFSFNGVSIDPVDDVETGGQILLDIYDSKYNLVELAVCADKFNLPAGTYSVSDQGSGRRIVPSNGLYNGFFPYYSFANINYDNYFVTAGSVEISFSGDGGTLYVNGELQTAHGSVISVSASGENRFKPYEPQTFQLTSSSVTASTGTYPSGNPYFRLDIAAQCDGNPVNGSLLVNTDIVTGEFYYADLGYCTMNGIEIKGDDTFNCLTVSATGNTDEYSLNARISFGEEGDYCIYEIKDAIFIYTPPTPFDAESDDAVVIDFETAADASVYPDDNGFVLEFYDASFDVLRLKFPLTDAAALLPGRYVVDDSGENCSLAASRGRLVRDGQEYESCTFFGEGMTEEPYYIVGGYVDISFDDDKMLLDGVLESKKGSVINVSVATPASGFQQNPLPGNVLSGYLHENKGVYVIAFEATSDADGHVMVATTLVVPQDLQHVSSSLEYDGKEKEMACDSETGSCVFVTEESFGTGTVMSFTLKLYYDGLETRTRTVEYVVE